MTKAEMSGNKKESTVAPALIEPADDDDDDKDDGIPSPPKRSRAVLGSSSLLPSFLSASPLPDVSTALLLLSNAVRLLDENERAFHVPPSPCPTLLITRPTFDATNSCLSMEFQEQEQDGPRLRSISPAPAVPRSRGNSSTTSNAIDHNSSDKKSLKSIYDRHYNNMSNKFWQGGIASHSRETRASSSISPLLISRKRIIELEDDPPVVTMNPPMPSSTVLVTAERMAKKKTIPDRTCATTKKQVLKMPPPGKPLAGPPRLPNMTSGEVIMTNKRKRAP